MGLPVEVNNLMMGSLGGYTIGRSLRFRSSASAYLNRTPASAGNRTTWTWSAWVKRGSLGSAQRLFDSISSNGSVIGFNASNQLQFNTGDGATAYNFASTALFRDPSAWYHIVCVCNTTSATTTQTGTTSDRLQMWVNGVQLSSFSTNNVPAQNFAGAINSTNAHYIASDVGTASYFDGYLAEVNFVNAQALTPSSFGAYDTNGVWQPIRYSGTYGTNGFYLPFSNTTSTTTLVQDSSGNGNNWTPNNISLTAGTTYDSMIDSPTVSASASNYAVLNPLAVGGFYTGTLSNGNLSTSWSGSYGQKPSTIAFSSGLWYAEVTLSGTANGGVFGIELASGVSNGGWSFVYDGSKYTAGVRDFTVVFPTWAANTVLMLAVDATNGKLYFGQNGSWFGSANPSAGTGANMTFTAGSQYVISAPASGNVGTGSVNFGQRPFAYTPPTGYNALNTYNLPAPSIANGAQNFDINLWSGNASTQTITNSASMAPDLVWIKKRAGGTTPTRSPRLIDSVRGATKTLYSDSTSAELTETDGLTAFNSNGFTLGATDGVNGTTGGTGTYVGWQWKAGGTGVTNNSGTITSTVSANPTAGFSVVTYTGTGANATVGHGLGVAPNMIIAKKRSAAEDWVVYQSSVSSTPQNSFLYLDLTSALQSSVTVWNNTAPTSSVFTVGTSGAVNGSSATYVAYCFAAVSGYSAFGSWSGTANSDGPFIFTNFRPRFILWKNASLGTADWEIVDTSRDTYNAAGLELFPNTSGAETDSRPRLDILSNGFKVRSTGAGINGSGNTIIYAAFAESPFRISRAR